MFRKQDRPHSLRFFSKTKCYFVILYSVLCHKLRSNQWQYRDKKQFKTMLKNFCLPKWGAAHFGTNIPTLYKILQYTDITHNIAIYRHYTKYCNIPTLHTILQYTDITHNIAIYRHYTQYYNIPTLHTILQYTDITHNIAISVPWTGQVGFETQNKRTISVLLKHSG